MINPFRLAREYLENYSINLTEENTHIHHVKKLIHPLKQHLIKIHPKTEDGRNNLKRAAKLAYDNHGLLARAWNYKKQF